MNAALALNGFNEHGNNVVPFGGHFFDRVDVVIRHNQKAWSHLAKPGLQFCVAGGCNRCQSASMERGLGNQDHGF